MADTGGQFIDLSASVAGTLFVKVDFSNVATPGGTLPGGSLPSTLPGTTLPNSGNVKGLTGGGNIIYMAQWTPPVLLVPPPSLTLISGTSNQTDTFFTIPSLTPPTEAAGTKLPDTALAFSIPVAGETAGTALPNVASTFDVPSITISTNAPSFTPDLPDTTATSTAGFTIPSLTAVTSTAADFPSATDLFAIPTVSVATSSVSSFGTGVDLQFTVPDPATGSTGTPQVVKGMAHDGTDYWFIVAGSANDKIMKVDGTTFARLSTSTAPNKNFQGIAFVGNTLFLAEAQGRCNDDIEPNSCNFNSRIFKIPDTSNMPASGVPSAWAAGSSNAVTAIIHVGQDHQNLAGLTEGDSGTLWTVPDNGDRFYNINSAGVELDSKQFHQRANAIAFRNGFLYTADGSTTTQSTDEGSRVQERYLQKVCKQSGGVRSL